MALLAVLSYQFDGNIELDRKRVKILLLVSDAFCCMAHTCVHRTGKTMIPSILVIFMNSGVAIDIMEVDSIALIVGELVHDGDSMSADFECV
ncbi:hypothetical protein PC128_g18694 [Phytophthora cactorum]|nr:hypothetical protein PC128_g18694 [Phytophthora cactorum]